jgi:hypothetical protein
MDVHHREFTDRFRRDAYQTPGNRVDNRGMTLENHIAITDFYTTRAPLIEENDIACTYRDTVLLGRNDHAGDIFLGYAWRSLRQAHERTGSNPK